MKKGKLFVVGFLAFLQIFPSLMLEVNQECQVFDNITKKYLDGICKNINECSDYSNYLFTSNQTPQYCGFNQKIPSILCCLPSIPKPPPPVGLKSIRYCSVFLEEADREKLIDFGVKAHPKEFGHMVAVGYVDKNNKIMWLCGGSIISHYFVISAAHCAHSSDYGPPRWLRVGDLDLSDTADDARPKDMLIDQIYIHPDYKFPSHHNDIVLFETEKWIHFGVYVKPICLNIDKTPSFDYLEIIGWGREGYIGETSSHLLKAKVGIVPFENCRRRYASVSTRKLPGGINDNLQICAGDAEGRDTCPGDSGGPLHFKVPFNNSNNVSEHFVLVGITSFGKGCGGPNSIGVYTRVSSYVEWIESIVWPSDNLHPVPIDPVEEFYLSNE